MATTTIKHYPIDRIEIVRTLFDAFGELDDSDPECRLCGGVSRNAQKIPRLFQYGTRPDDRLSGWVNWTAGGFCSVGCWREYYQNYGWA